MCAYIYNIRIYIRTGTIPGSFQFHIIQLQTRNPPLTMKQKEKATSSEHDDVSSEDESLLSVSSATPAPQPQSQPLSNRQLQP